MGTPQHQEAAARAPVRHQRHDDEALGPLALQVGPQRGIRPGRVHRLRLQRGRPQRVPRGQGGALQPLAHAHPLRPHGRLQQGQGHGVRVVHRRGLQPLPILGDELEDAPVANGLGHLARQHVQHLWQVEPGLGHQLADTHQQVQARGALAAVLLEQPHAPAGGLRLEPRHVLALVEQGAL